MSMENLVSQVPELKLTKTVHTRTTHTKDNPKYPDRVGDVRKFIVWEDEKGKQWTRADIMFYINMNELREEFDRLNAIDTNPSIESEDQIAHVNAY